MWSRVVPNATLTPFEARRLDTPDGVQPSRAISGAVYDSRHRLVHESQRVGGLHGDHASSVNPAEYRDPPSTVLSGRWLYGGTWFNHFGHFLTETVTTLWPRSTIDGIVFHQFWFGRDLSPWQRDAVALTGHSGVPIEVVGRSSIGVESLIVPARAIIPHAYALPAAAAVWRRMAESARDFGDAGGRRVFLSRARVNASEAATEGTGSRAARLGDNDDALDGLAASLEFEVVHPETMSFPRQVALASGADVLVGPSGSQLHLSVFARPSTRVLELGDRRNRSAPVRTQVILCAASGQPLEFEQHGDGSGYDLERIAVALRTSALS